LIKIKQMKPIVIYQGKYGATRQYAEWIADFIKCPVFQPRELSNELNSAEVLILGSSVYIGKLQLRDWLKRNAPAIENKSIFLFVVCGTPPEKRVQLEGYLKTSVPAGIIDKCSIFFLPGRLVYKKLSGMDKFLLRMGALLGDANTKKSMLTDYDSVKRANLEPLLKEIKKVLEKDRISEPV
jgi:menaquinone-dependent protoporphyrinogen IX oxidase